MSKAKEVKVAVFTQGNQVAEVTALHTKPYHNFHRVDLIDDYGVAVEVIKDASRQWFMRIVDKFNSEYRVKWMDDPTCFTSVEKTLKEAIEYGISTVHRYRNRPYVLVDRRRGVVVGRFNQA